MLAPNFSSTALCLNVQTFKSSNVVVLIHDCSEFSVCRAKFRFLNLLMGRRLWCSCRWRSAVVVRQFLSILVLLRSLQPIFGLVMPVAKHCATVTSRWFWLNFYFVRKCSQQSVTKSPKKEPTELRHRFGVEGLFQGRHKGRRLVKRQQQHQQQQQLEGSRQVWEFCSALLCQQSRQVCARVIIVCLFFQIELLFIYLLLLSLLCFIRNSFESLGS